MDDACEAVITAPDPEWLTKFTHGLVADRLCASSRTLTGVRFIYLWRGGDLVRTA